MDRAGDAEAEESETFAIAVGDAVAEGLDPGAGLADEVGSFGREDAAASGDAEPRS